MKFCGKFKGCVRETVVTSKGVSESESKAVINVKNINCSNKTAYLITVVDSDGEFNNLAYREDLDKPVLRSITQNGNGVTSTYYEGKYLIHQVSIVRLNSKGETEQWKVKYYKVKQC
jgi:hypothetical protein